MTREMIGRVSSRKIPQMSLASGRLGLNCTHGWNLNQKAQPVNKNALSNGTHRSRPLSYENRFLTCSHNTLLEKRGNGTKRHHHSGY